MIYAFNRFFIATFDTYKKHKMKKIESILREKTCEMFSEKWYDDVCSSIEKHLTEDSSGYVYFVKSNITGLVKIGMAKNIMTRLCSLRQSNGSLSLLGFLYGEDYKKIEKEIHCMFSLERSYGEWFDLPLESCLSEIKNRKGVVVDLLFKPSMFIQDGEITRYTGEVSQKDILENAVFKYLSENISIGDVYDSNKLFKEISIDKLSQKKMTILIMKYARDNDLQYNSFRTHNCRKFSLSYIN